MEQEENKNERHRKHNNEDKLEMGRLYSPNGNKEMDMYNNRVKVMGKKEKFGILFNKMVQ